VALDACP
jgi:hypothetical protein